MKILVVTKRPYFQQSAKYKVYRLHPDDTNCQSRYIVAASYFFDFFSLSLVRYNTNNETKERNITGNKALNDTTVS